MPPRPEKLKSHLWDQVEAIATCLKERGFDVARPLMRIGSSQQKRLSKVARSENAGKSYSLSPVACLPLPNAVVIIDDVYTTGATIDACARALIAGGANRVSALVLAMD